jgi:hypothetical protein
VDRIEGGIDSNCDERRREGGTRGVDGVAERLFLRAGEVMNKGFRGVVGE